MSTFKIVIKNPRDLSSAEQEAWSAFRAQNPALYSPYFDLEYTKIVSDKRGKVHVLIASNAGKPAIFLPFQAKISASGKIGFANPVGSPMTDYHGFVCAPGTVFDPASLLKQAGFGAFHFSALVDSYDGCNSGVSTPCTMMDVSAGAAEWREGRDSSYRRHLKSHRRRVRKSGDLGERRFEFMSQDPVIFDQLINWKQQKFALTGKFDVLAVGWTLELLNELWKRREGLQAHMHALYFGDQLAAIDLGLSDGTTFHSWIVAYNNEFHTLAPGIQLLEGLIDEAGALGYKRIDLGEGLDGYKRQYASERISVSTGFIAAAGPAAALSKIYSGLENFGEKKLGGIGKIPGKTRRRYTQISACEPALGKRAKAMLTAIKTAGQ